MSRAELAQLPTGGMAVAVIPAILTVAFLTLVVQKTYPMDTRGFTSVFQGSIRLNTYLGLAIAGGVMGAKGLEYAAYTAAVMITLVNFLSVVTVERFVGMNSGWWSLLKSVLANPLILACVLGMVFSIFEQFFGNGGGFFHSSNSIFIIFGGYKCYGLIVVRKTIIIFIFSNAK